MKQRIVLSALIPALALGLSALPASAAGTQAHWVTSWAASPLPSGAIGPLPPSPSFSNQTIRQTLRVSAGGGQLRLRLTNEYGTKPLKIGAATVAVVQKDGSTGPAVAVNFNGARTTLIPAGAPLLSDAVALKVAPLAQLVVSLYLPEDTGPCTCHGVGAQDAQISDAGDFTAAASFTPKQTAQYRAFLSGVEVDAPGGRTIVTFGDSITDGVGSTPNKNRRWPDQFIERLHARQGGTSWAIANQGISGNRVLEPGMGESALTRFDRDVISQAGVTHVVIFEGVNDLGLSYGNPTGPNSERMKSMLPREKATAEALIGGYRQLIARAHAHGIKVIGATIAPYEGASYWAPEGEAQRQKVNAWIRTGGEVDGVIDFDAAVRDPAKPSQMKDGLHMGDHLHGSDAGYEAMAKAIDLGLFR